MKRIALFLGVAAALVASCSVQEDDFVAPQRDDVIFCASFELPSEGTKVYVNENLLLRWTADDRISIFNKNTYNQQYRFAGETGDNAGGFRKVDTDEFVTGNAISNVVSVYPYQEATKITESGMITLTLPTEQHYAENTFGLGANTMVSVSEDNFLQFKTVGGYLMFKLYGEGVSVSSITLKGNNGEKLAGKATVTMPLEGAPTAVLADGATSEINLVCNTPVSLGATEEASTLFWFVIPPVSFSKGFTLTVKDTSGGVFEKSTSKSIAIERNKLTKMSPMKVEIGTPTVPIPEAVDLGLPSGLKWASFNVGASKPEEYGDYYSWGETVPKNNYSWATYKWCNGSSNALTKYNTQSNYGVVDNKTILDPEDDAATTQYGEEWRMPTHNEFQELKTLCSWKYTTRNGNKGYLVTGPNGNSMFMPSGGNSVGFVGSYGCYWGADLGTTTDQYGCNFDFTSSFTDLDDDLRYLGRCIRAVKGHKTSEAINLSINGTANCYIVSSPGRYLFNASVKGNSSETVGIPVNAEVLWESFNTGTRPSVGDIVRDVVVSDGNVYFLATGTDGNALIAVKDSEGTILWSWHIWVTDYDPNSDYDTYKGHESVKMMDRNLGAMSSEPGIKSIGLIYEWGRKDPFLGSTSLTSYSQFASTTSFPDCKTSNSTIGTEKFAAENPTQYIIANSQNQDWLYTSNDNAWSSEKSKNDPCPKGWKVPDGGQNSVWSSFPSSISSTSGVTWNSTYRGINISESLVSNPVWYPAQGYHGDSDTYSSSYWQVGSEGRYWTTTTLGKGSDYFQFKTSTIETYHTSTSTHFSRANGMPVRCCSE